MCKAKLKGAHLREFKRELMRGALPLIRGMLLPRYIDISLSVYLFIESEQ